MTGKTKKTLCSHCEKNVEPAVLTGFRLVPTAKKGELLPYAFCRSCSGMLRSISKKRYNNAPNADRDKIKALFWKKVDRVLMESHSSAKTTKTL